MRFVLAVLTVALVMMMAGPSRAKQPTWGQCSCPASDKDPNQPDRYSTVRNASLCVNTEGTDPEPLCTVTVHCLDDGVTGPNCGEHPGNRGLPGYDDFIAVIPELAEAHYRQMQRDTPFDVKLLVSFLENNRNELASCWNYFRKIAGSGLSEVDAMSVSSKEISCTVTRAGWLHITVPGVLLEVRPSEEFGAISFQFAPMLLQ